MADQLADLRSAATILAENRLAGADLQVHYERLAESLRRHNALDARTLGPELARLQCFPKDAPPQRPNLRGRLVSLIFKILNPVLGRVLRVASLSSPFQASYQAVVYVLELQLESEHRMSSEIAVLQARVAALEEELRLLRRSP